MRIRGTYVAGVKRECLVNVVYFFRANSRTQFNKCSFLEGGVDEIRLCKILVKHF